MHAYECMTLWKSRSTYWLAASFLLLVLSPLGAAAAPPITIAVDATQAPRRFFSATLTIPAQPGPLTLQYPKWIPGEHGPTGPIVDSAGLTFRAMGKTIPWQRDALDMFTYHLNVPDGVASIEAALDYLSPAAGEGGFSAGATSTDQMAVISWNTLLLYPSGAAANELTYQASLKLPAAWQFGTALPLAGQRAGIVDFTPVSLETLVDSPVIAGAHFRRVPLSAPGAAPPVEMDIAADSDAALNMSGETEAHYRQLVAEAESLFGAEHFREYHFLLSLSDHLPHFGLEHHQSNDSRASERSLIDPAARSLMATLLPHEFVHSWNGKYRRPADLTTPDYERPMQTDLLWVYEGLTQYLGGVLATRAGLWTPEQYRENLASVAAELDHQSGRTWRPLQDTATDAQILYDAPRQWADWRRGTDFYDEGILIWLEADMTIRQKTNGQRSLDDFCKLFYGAPSTAPMVKPYTFDDVVSALNQVAPFDWKTFFATRLQSTDAHAPLGGIESSGWNVVYRDAPGALLQSAYSTLQVVDARFSLGLSIDDKGRVIDVNPLMPAGRQGLAPGMRIIAVNSRAFSGEVLNDALKQAASVPSDPIELLVENTGYYRTYTIDYQGGPKYPQLERNGSRPDELGDIIRAHASSGHSLTR
jgi:predicted metalloprotease with PDZ domain